MNPPIEKVEKQRLRIQNRLDDYKTQFERNKLGQFATPPSLSSDIMRYAKKVMSKEEKIRFLDPAFGTGSFYSALLSVFDSDQIEEAVGYEIDDYYAKEAKRVWRGTPLILKVADFTTLAHPISSDKANLIICNPPYVRHHHLSLIQKERLRALVEKSIGIRISGLSGLYCYYMLISHQWLSSDGIAGWLIPSEFMDVNYGAAVKQYLLDKVTLLRIHRFDPADVQFSDADVSSAVVWFKNAPPPKGHSVEFTLGGTHANPLKSKFIPADILRKAPKWTAFPTLQYDASKAKSGRTLADLFGIKRGLATGANEFFIMDKAKASKYKIPEEFLIPILPMPRELTGDEVKSDERGLPIMRPQLFLLSCSLPEEDVRVKYPALHAYLKTGIESGIDKRYLCKHRSPWYSQEERPAAPFLCSYFGRKTSSREKPFRFILNRSKATASNSYLLLYPKPELRRLLDSDSKLYYKLWWYLKAITSEKLVSSGRVYGGGLHKLEPNELASVPIEGFEMLFAHQ